MRGLCGDQFGGHIVIRTEIERPLGTTKLIDGYLEELVTCLYRLLRYIIAKDLGGFSYIRALP